MTDAIYLLAALAWWALLAGLAGLLAVLTLAVFFHAFPNGGDDE